MKEYPLRTAPNRWRLRMGSRHPGRKHRQLRCGYLPYTSKCTHEYPKPRERGAPSVAANRPVGGRWASKTMYTPRLGKIGRFWNTCASCTLRYSGSIDQIHSVFRLNSAVASVSARAPRTELLLRTFVSEVITKCRVGVGIECRHFGTHELSEGPSDSYQPLEDICIASRYSIRGNTSTPLRQVQD